MRFLYIIFLYIRLQSDGQVSIRDGAFSVFDKSKVIEEFGPTQGLKVNLCNLHIISFEWFKCFVFMLYRPSSLNMLMRRPCREDVLNQKMTIRHRLPWNTQPSPRHRISSDIRDQQRELHLLDSNAEILLDVSIR